MNADLLALSALRSATVLLGAWIILLSFRAYRASHRRSLAWLTAAVTLITLGALAEGAAFNLGWTLDDARFLDAALNLAAMGVLAAALTVRERIAQRQRGQAAYERDDATTAR